MNYISLKASIDDWLARSDISDETISDTLIDLAEARINRILRVKAMETVYDETIANGVTDYPSTCLEFKHLYLYSGDGDTLSGDGIVDPTDNTVRELEWRGFDAFSREYQGSSGVPCFAARQADKIIYWPAPQGTYKASGVYYAAFTPLSDNNTSNWLSTNAPDLLLSAVLTEASAYIKSPDQLQYWQGRRDQAMAEIQAEDDKAEFSATPLTMRMVNTP